MIPLHQFAMDIDADFKDPIEIGKADGKIRKKVNSADQLLPDEKIYYDIICSGQRKKYRHHWAKYLDKNLIYKKPYFINAGQFQHIDDDVDGLQFGNGDYVQQSLG